MPPLRPHGAPAAADLPRVRRQNQLQRLRHPAVEEELAELLPGARILRMDQDSTSRKDAHETMLAQFARHEI